MKTVSAARRVRRSPGCADAKESKSRALAFRIIRNAIFDRFVNVLPFKDKVLIIGQISCYADAVPKRAGQTEKTGALPSKDPFRGYSAR